MIFQLAFHVDFFFNVYYRSWKQCFEHSHILDAKNNEEGGRIGGFPNQDAQCNETLLWQPINKNIHKNGVWVFAQLIYS